MNFPHDHQQQCPRQPTTGFVLIRTHQVDIVARHCCLGLTKRCLPALHVSERLWVKRWAVNDLAASIFRTFTHKRSLTCNARKQRLVRPKQQCLATMPT